MHYMQFRTALVVLAAAFILSLVHPSSAQAEDDENRVRRVIAGLETTWNGADMEGYLSAYRQDNSLSLTYGNTVVQGFDAMNTLFRNSYPDEMRMGKFTIDEITVTMLGDTALAYGNFTHIFSEETVIGGYSHVLVKQGDDWIILHERTSRAEVIATE
jgi:uncharacterized protein (TIGR02246 family)